MSRIDSLAGATLSEGPVAGLSIGVKRGGDLLLAKGYGEADVENHVPTTAETVYRIGGPIEGSASGRRTRSVTGTYDAPAGTPS